MSWRSCASRRARRLGKFFGGDSVEERVVVCGRFVFRRESFRLLTSVYSLGLSKFQKGCIRIIVTLGSEDR